jgi:DeoR family deoxyribose operon repressor
MPVTSIRQAAAVSGAKEAVGARTFGDGKTIVVDRGATTARLARRPPLVMRLTVVCYALDIVEPLTANPNAQRIRFGGRFGASPRPGGLSPDGDAIPARGLRPVERFVGALEQLRRPFLVA